MSDYFTLKLPSQKQGQILEVDVHRNEPCPCASGRKAKKCHFANASEATENIADSRLWPIQVACAYNVLQYIAELIKLVGQSDFNAATAPAQAQKIAVAFYACIGYRVGSAIVALMGADQGEEAMGLRRELNDARMSLAYYQEFQDEVCGLSLLATPTNWRFCEENKREVFAWMNARKLCCRNWKKVQDAKGSCIQRLRKPEQGQRIGKNQMLW